MFDKIEKLYRYIQSINRYLINQSYSTTLLIEIGCNDVCIA